MSLKLLGMDTLTSNFNAYLDKVRLNIADVRRQIAAELVDALLADTPVWSGKTARSIAVGNSPDGGNRSEPHPDRRDTAKNGPWKNHKKDFGDTREMSLGQEPMRSAAEAIARASVGDTDYGMGAEVYVSSDSYMWDIIDTATYRPDARNTAVVSRTAIAQVKSKFGSVVR